jgi:gliding motility-associatede transport system auxiliary component
MDNESSSSFLSRQVKYGLNLAVYALAALAIVVVVNLIANRFVKQVDLTANKRYSLSPQTNKILKDLNRDVELLYFDRKSNFNNVRDALEQYAVAAHRVKVTYVDPDREPGKAQKYNVKTYGTLIVATGEKSETAKSVKEEDLTATIIRLLKGGPKTVYFLQGHGERDIASDERLGYSGAKKLLEESNYQVKTVSLMEQSPKVPADATVLVVAGPTKDLLDPELAAIRDYIKGGGRVLFLVNPLTPPKLVGLLDEFGADAHNTLVVDTSGIGRLFGTDELMPLVVQYENDPITKDLTNVATLFPFSAAIKSSSKNMPGVSFKLLAKTTDKSWATTDVHAKQISFREGKDEKGPLALAGAGTYKPLEGGEGAKEGRYVVSGSTDFLSNAILGFNGNKDLFLNMVNWLSSDEDLISIRPKDQEDRGVNLTARQMQLVFYFSLVFVPLLVIGGGLTVWWKRRA